MIEKIKRESKICCFRQWRERTRQDFGIYQALLPGGRARGRRRIGGLMGGVEKETMGA